MSRIFFGNLRFPLRWHPDKNKISDKNICSKFPSILPTLLCQKCKSETKRFFYFFWIQCNFIQVWKFAACSLNSKGHLGLLPLRSRVENVGDDKHLRSKQMFHIFLVKLNPPIFSSEWCKSVKPMFTPIRTQNQFRIFPFCNKIVSPM